MLRRAGDPQDSCISMTQQLSLFFHGARAIEKDAAAPKQLLALGGQKKPAPDAIEKSQAELQLEVDNLSRQSRLSDPQAQGCLGDGAKFGHSYESTGVPQVHTQL